MKPSARSANPIDYSPYAGRWIAIVRDRVAGVGRTRGRGTAGGQGLTPQG